MEQNDIDKILKDQNLNKPRGLKEHIVEVLAMIAVLQFVVVIFYVLFREVKSNDSTTLMILTSSGNIAMLVLAFYFGSSKGSKDKQAKLDEIEASK